MMEPERLLDGEGTSLERQLLAAGVSDEPSPAALRRAAAWFSVAVTTGAVAGGAAAATSPPATWTTVAGLGLGVLGLGTVGVLVVGLALSPADPGAAAPGPTLETPAAPLPTPSATPPPVTATATATATTREEPEEPADAAPPAPTARRAPAAPPADKSAGKGSLPEEVAMVDAARRALGAGNAPLALEILDRHRQEHPRGLLGQEATLLRIEALAVSGQRSAARSLAASFLGRQPRSPHRKRIESLVGPIPLP